MSRKMAILLAIILAAPLLAPIALAGHPDRCAACHYSLYYDTATGKRGGDLVNKDFFTGFGGTWSHEVYTYKAWAACKECHPIWEEVNKSVHKTVGCGCHAVIHAGKFEADTNWVAWVATAIIGVDPTADQGLQGLIEKAFTPTSLERLPAYKPTIPSGLGFGEGLPYLTRLLLRLPGTTPTAAPKFSNSTLAGYYNLYEYFTFIDNSDSGDYGTRSYGVEVQLLTFRYKPTLSWIGPAAGYRGTGLVNNWGSSGPQTDGPIVLPIGTRTDATQNMYTGPYNNYAHANREAWLVCYNCHFVTGVPGGSVSTSPIRFMDGFWLIGVPASAFEFTDPHSIQPVTVTATSEAPAVNLAALAQSLVAVFGVAAGLGLAVASRRIQ